MLIFNIFLLLSLSDLGLESQMEKAIATHSNTLDWKIPWVEEPGRLQPVVSQQFGHD